MQDANSVVTAGGDMAWDVVLRERLKGDLAEVVAMLAARTDAAAHDAAAQVQIEFERTQAVLVAQRAEAQATLEAERERAKWLSDELACERTSRQRAEAAESEVRLLKESATAAYTERIHILELQLEAATREHVALAERLAAEAAEHMRVSAVLESIRATLGGGIVEAVHTEPGRTESPAAGSEPTAPAPVSDIRPRAAADAEAKRPSAGSTSMNLVPSPRRKSDPQLAEYARELLDQVEHAYVSDVNATRMPAEVVDRLVGELRTARDLFAARCYMGGQSALLDEFDRQLSEALDTKNATPFGRHLSIAAYEVSQPAVTSVHCAVAS